MRNLRLLTSVLWLSAASLLLSACGTPPPYISLKPQSFSEMEGWESDNHQAAFESFLKSCDSFEKRSSSTTLGCGDIQSPASTWQSICAAARTERVSAREFFETYFAPYGVTQEDGDRGLFTGYYIPEIRGSRTRHGAFQTPVYRMPADVQKGVGYFTRAEINAGALKNRGLEIAWVDDPVQLFFIEIQGSGVITLEEGGIMTIGFAGKNNREYVALGRFMGEEGMLDKDAVNLFTIKDWLYKNPQQARQVMERNPSFVFFQEMKDNMVKGAQNVGLTAERSLAVDYHFYPYGMPVFLQTNLPETRFGAEMPFNQLVIAQDTGGAIRGGIRGDIYFGYGARAEALAGHQAERGTMSILLPPDIARSLKLEHVNACVKK